MENTHEIVFDYFDPCDQLISDDGSEIRDEIDIFHFREQYLSDRETFVWPRDKVKFLFFDQYGSTDTVVFTTIGGADKGRFFSLAVQFLLDIYNQDYLRDKPVLGGRHILKRIVWNSAEGGYEIFVI